jgi:2-amino-4-hydroxy-6-hydroxymethyldihydropteridine diphosphokinase
LSIGSNIEPQKHIQACKLALLNAFSQVRFSKTYESQAVGFKGDNFYNLAAEIDDNRDLVELIKKVKSIEEALGRVRNTERFSARHIDIDIILYGDLVCREPIELPRPEILDSAYVLCPLVELAPELIAPDVGKTYLSLWQDFDKTRQPLLLVDEKVC